MDWQKLKSLDLEWFLQDLDSDWESLQLQVESEPHDPDNVGHSELDLDLVVLRIGPHCQPGSSDSLEAKYWCLYLGLLHEPYSSC